MSVLGSYDLHEKAEKTQVHLQGKPLGDSTGFRGLNVNFRKQFCTSLLLVPFLACLSLLRTLSVLTP